MRLTTSFLVLGLLSLTARAQQHVEFQTTLPPSPVPSTQTALLPGFDPMLGVLRSYEITVSGWVNGSLAFENTSAAATVAPNYSVGALIIGSGPSGVLGSAPNPAFEYTPQPPPPLAAFDGTLDFAGTSALTIPFVNQGGTGAPSITYPFFSDQSLVEVMAAIAITGGLSLTVSSTGFTGGGLPSGIQEAHTISTGMTLRVRYNYDVLPTRICRAGQNAGCPCGNNGITDGGCRNSGGGLGGTVMTYGGVASLSNDTLALMHLHAPSGAPVLFFQGTAFSYAQTVFGDGLMCVGGAIARLGVKISSIAPFPGNAGYPGVGDPSISSAGGIAAPGNRYYQVFYRDAGVYCTSATHNVSSGLAFTWQP